MGKLIILNLIDPSLQREEGRRTNLNLAKSPVSGEKHDFPSFLCLRRRDLIRALGRKRAFRERFRSSSRRVARPFGGSRGEKNERYLLRRRVSRLDSEDSSRVVERGREER